MGMAAKLKVDISIEKVIETEKEIEILTKKGKDRRNTDRDRDRYRRDCQYGCKSRRRNRDFRRQTSQIS